MPVAVFREHSNQVHPRSVFESPDHLPACLGLRRRGATVAGWFGPIGVSAVFYLGHSLEGGVSDPRRFAAGTLAVAASVVAFGVTGAPGRKAYARS